MGKPLFLRNRLWNLTEEEEYNFAVRFYHRLRIIDNVLLRRARGSVLEAGCGDGRFLLKLKSLDCVTSIRGIDICPDAVKRAQKRGFEVIRANGEDLPFKNGTFDVVLAAHGSPKEMNMELLLSEVHRVLRPGGVFAFDTYNKYPLEKIAKYRIIRLFHIGNAPFPGTSGGVEDMEKFEHSCSQSGFDIVSLSTLFPLPFLPYGILLRGRMFCQANTHLIGVLKRE